MCERDAGGRRGVMVVGDSGMGGMQRGQGRVIVAIRDGPGDPCDAHVMCHHLHHCGGAMVSVKHVLTRIVFGVYTTKCEPELGMGASVMCHRRRCDMCGGTQPTRFGWFEGGTLTKEGGSRGQQCTMTKLWWQHRQGHSDS